MVCRTMMLEITSIKVNTAVMMTVVCCACPVHAERSRRPAKAVSLGTRISRVQLLSLSCAWRWSADNYAPLPADIPSQRRTQLVAKRDMHGRWATHASRVFIRDNVANAAHSALHSAFHVHGRAQDSPSILQEHACVEPRAPLCMWLGDAD